MRERPEQVAIANSINGITPARAGKTTGYAAGNVPEGDHPRSCGKDRLLCHRRRWQTGSPPLVRERLFPFSGANEGIGITPARAGKTAENQEHPQLLQDHPRSCGKDLYPALFAAAVLGSPPLVRERHLMGLFLVC